MRSKATSTFIFSLETTIREKKEKREEKSEKNKKKRQSSAENCRFFFGGEQGLFRRTAVHLRVATLLDRGLSNSPPDCFHRLCRPSLFESLADLSTKNIGHSKCYTLYFLAESKGFFGVLPYAFASLRSLTADFQTVHRTVFIGFADRPCSNPLLTYSTKKYGVQQMLYPVFLGGEQGIRTLETVLAVYTISNRAPSTSSDNSPCYL